MAKSNKSDSARLARRFVEFANAQNLKGKARDRAAFYFMTGAANAHESDGGVTMLAFLAGIRGYSAVSETAGEPS